MLTARDLKHHYGFPVRVETCINQSPGQSQFKMGFYVHGFLSDRFPRPQMNNCTHSGCLTCIISCHSGEGQEEALLEPEQ